MLSVSQLTSSTGRRPVVALYLRVSTADRQELDNQGRELRAYARRQNWSVFETYTDRASGASQQRPGLDAMLEAASRKQFDAVVVYDLSRLTRGGPATAFAVLERLHTSGVELWSYREEYFRTPVAGPILFAIAAFFAQQEREMIRYRVKSGIERARAAGRVLGRPLFEIDKTELLRLRLIEGWSFRKLAKHFKAGKGTIERKLHEATEEENKDRRRPRSRPAQKKGRARVGTTAAPQPGEGPRN